MIRAADACSYTYNNRLITANCSGSIKNYKAFNNYESLEAVERDYKSGILLEAERDYLHMILGGKTLYSSILEKYDNKTTFEEAPWMSYKEGGEILEGDFEILHLVPVPAADGGMWSVADQIILRPRYVGALRGGVSENQALITNLNGDSFREITLSYTNENEKPTSNPRITKGRIAGLLIAGGKWESTFSDIVTKGKVGLYRIEDDGSKSIVNLTNKGENCDSGDNYRTPRDYGGGKYGFSILLGCTEYGNGLVEGKYAVAFAHSENGDAWGDTKPKPWDNLFNVDFYGEIQFTLTNSSAPGFGDLAVFGSLDEGERVQSSTDIEPKDISSKGSVVSITETSTAENTFADIMNRAINIVLAAVTEVIDWGGKLIHKMLIWGNDIEMDASGATTGKAGIRQVWESTRNMGLSLLTLVLLMVAFANIINVKLDQYGITKIIPKIIIAIVMTYFSFFIAAFLLDLMSALQALLFQEASKGSYFQLSSQINGTIIGQVGQSYDLGDLISRIPELLFLEILCVCVAIVVLWLLLVLVVRNAMIFILVSVAPIAFLAMILPFTEKYYKQWWASFWKWAFIGPAIAFMLWLTQQFLGGYGASAFGTFGSDINGAWTFLIAAAVMLWLTATLPLKMGSEVYGQLTKHKDKIPGYRAGKSFLDARKASANQRSAQRAAILRGKLASSGRIGQLLAGVNKQQALGLKAQTYAALAEGAPTDKAQFNAALASAKGMKREALLLHGAKEGLLDAENKITRDIVAKALEENNIPDLEKTILKNQSDFFTAAAAGDGKEIAPDPRFFGQATKALSGKGTGDYKGADWRELARRDSSAFEKIAKQKSAVDAALKAPRLHSDEFVKQIAPHAHLIEDKALYEEVKSRASQLDDASVAAMIQPQQNQASPTVEAEQAPQIQIASEADVRREINQRRQQ